MDCPFERITKQDAVPMPENQKPFLVFVRGTQGCGKTTLAEFLLASATKAGFKCCIFEANANMQTGYSGIESYSAGKVRSAHAEMQQQLRTKLGQGYNFCIVSNCSIKPTDIQMYTNSDQKIKVKGSDGVCYSGKVWQLTRIHVLNMLPIRFPNKRVMESRKNVYELDYAARPIFSGADVAVFSLGTVTQYAQVYLDTDKSQIYYNLRHEADLQIVKCIPQCAFDAVLKLF